LIKALKKELLIYIGILVALSLLMHPERISMVESPYQLIHPFAWSFGVYVVVAVLRWIVSVVLKVFKRKKAES
jgi:uncharacterized membrane protein